MKKITKYIGIASIYTMVCGELFWFFPPKDIASCILAGIIIMIIFTMWGYLMYFYLQGDLEEKI